MSESEEEISKNMTGAIIKRCISNVGRNAEGNGYAYLKLDLENRELETMCEDLSGYQQLKYVHFSGNKFNNIMILTRLPNVLRLELSTNRISSLDFFNIEETFLNLQFLDLSRNMIRNLTSIKLPKLIHLNLNYNEIINTDQFLGHPNLKIFEIRGNKIANVGGLKSMPKLEELYLCENNITFIDTLEDLSQLKKLHLRKNNINNLDEEKIPELPELQYLNLRENNIKDINKVNNLKKYNKLTKLVLGDNPFWTSEDLSIEILIFMPRLIFINKQEIEDLHRELAYNLAADRFKVAEAVRKEAERKAQEALDKET
jgi:Leucine-rich repeat (LRR) protein